MRRFCCTFYTFDDKAHRVIVQGKDYLEAAADGFHVLRKRLHSPQERLRWGGIDEVDSKFDLPENTRNRRGA